MPLFEVAFIERKKDGSEKLLSGPEAVLAPNRDMAIAAAAHGERVPLSGYLDKSNIEVLVRPFLNSTT
jgi:hypothetical protein